MKNKKKILLVSLGVGLPSIGLSSIIALTILKIKDNKKIKNNIQELNGVYKIVDSSKKEMMKIRNKMSEENVTNGIKTAQLEEDHSAAIQNVKNNHKIAMNDIIKSKDIDMTKLSSSNNAVLADANEEITNVKAQLVEQQRIVSSKKSEINQLRENHVKSSKDLEKANDGKLLLENKLRTAKEELTSINTKLDETKVKMGDMDLLIERNKEYHTKLSFDLTKQKEIVSSKKLEINQLKKDYNKSLEDLEKAKDNHKKVVAELKKAKDDLSQNSEILLDDLNKWFNEAKSMRKNMGKFESSNDLEKKEIINLNEKLKEFKLIFNRGEVLYERFLSGKNTKALSEYILKVYDSMVKLRTENTNIKTENKNLKKDLQMKKKIAKMRT